MFSFARLRHFLGQVMGIVIPFFLVALVMALSAEVWTRREDLPDALLDWRLWAATGIDMLPMIAAMVLTLWLAARFLQAFFRLGSRSHGMNFLFNSRCGLRGFGPWMRVQNGAPEPGKTGILERLGGPGHLVIYNDNAVVLERAGRLTRVVGAGFPTLRDFERVYDVVDLRPKRWVHTVSAMTKEGIPIRWDAEVHYQIHDGGIASTESTPYPVSPGHVLCAATSKWVHKGGEPALLNWEERLLLAETEASLRGILNGRRLDQLIGLTEDIQQAARESVRAELEEQLRLTAPDLGAKILSVQLDNLTVDDAVTQEWIKAWKARWQKWSAGQLAQAEASYVHQYEIAKAEAQFQMIVQITEAIHRQMASQALSPQAVPQMVLIRLFSVLDRADFAAASRVFFPTQTMEALDRIQKALAPAGGTSTP